MGRKRELSGEEAALWQGVARSVRPLKRLPKAEPDGAPPAAKPDPALPRPAAAAPAAAKPPRTPAPGPLDRRTRQRLARGRDPIEGRLDLHGMTQAEAHAVLGQFLRRAQADGLRFVLVVTGKGTRAYGSGEGERGVLRRQVPLWLGQAEFRALVAGFETAHAGHGGEGALYVRVRRLRS